MLSIYNVSLLQAALPSLSHALYVECVDQNRTVERVGYLSQECLGSQSWKPVVEECPLLDRVKEGQGSAVLKRFFF